MSDPCRRLLYRSSSIAVALVAAAMSFDAGAVPSTAITVTGDIASPKTYSLAGLAGFVPLTQTETYTAGGLSTTDTYTGASLYDVVASAQINVNAAIKNDLIDKVVLATATDGYRAVFSLGELSPNFGNRKDLVAYADTGGQIAGGAGFARLVADGDRQGGRYVSNASDLEVVSPPPLSSTYPKGSSTAFIVSGDVTARKTFDLAALKAFAPTSETFNGMTYTGVTFWNLVNSVGIATDATIREALNESSWVAFAREGFGC